MLVVSGWRAFDDVAAALAGRPWLLLLLELAHGVEFSHVRLHGNG